MSGSIQLDAIYTKVSRYADPGEYGVESNICPADRYGPLKDKAFIEILCFGVWKKIEKIGKIWGTGKIYKKPSGFVYLCC